MKRLLQLGIVLGFAGVLAGAYYFPWVSYARFPSAASVIANGGRGEQFLVRLPADRIQAAGSDVAGPRAGSYPAGAALLSTEGAATSRVEHFKLRDTTGNVLGVATRHWTVVDGVPVTAWMLNLPSRGSLVFSGAGEAPDEIESRLRRAGWSPGTAFAGNLTVDVGGVSRSVAATGEFADIGFQLVETWTVAGVDADGDISGTIELNTIGTRGS